MKRRPVLLPSLFVCLLARIAGAGIEGGMHDPEWFRMSDKILVLEYENPLGGSEGVQLSQLIGRMTLGTTRGLGNLAVITLRQTGERIVLDEANIKTLAERQRAPVVIWGEFYQREGRVFVTSHLRYSPNLRVLKILPDGELTNAKFSWDISQPGIPGATVAYAALPSAQINFAPIEISSADLSSLQEVWKKTVTIRAEPNESSPKRGELQLDRPYFVGDGMDGWTRVSTGDRSGWIRLTDLSQLNDFQGFTGVVLYALGLMQHLTNNPRAAAQTFTGYLEKYASRQDPMNQAVAHLFAGYSAMKNSQNLELSLSEFEKAKALLPNSSAPVNCMALAFFAKAKRSAPTENETLALEKELIRAVQTESDVDAIRNLGILYRLPQAEAHFKKKSPNFLQVRDTQLTVLRDLEQKAQGGPN